MLEAHHRSRIGWIVTFAGFGINVLVGISYTWSIFAEGLVNELGWSHAIAAAPYSVFLFCYAFSMIPAGRLQDQLGPRVVITLGAILAGAGFVVSGLVATPVAVTLLWGGLVGSGMACCFAAVTPAAMQWFPDSRKGLISGIVVTGVGVSAFILAPFVDWLIGFSINRAFVVSGLMLFTGIATLSRLVSVPAHANRGVTRSTTFASPLGSPLFRRFWLAFFFSTSAGVVIVSHLATLTRVHAGVGSGYLTVSVFSFFNAGGRIAAGILSDRIGRLRSVRTLFAGLLIALTGIYLSGSLASLGVAVGLLGLCYGGLFAVFPAATTLLFGGDDFGLKYGIVFSAIAFAGTMAWAAGLLFERYGTFHPAIIGLIGMCTAAIALSFTFGSEHPGNSSPRARR